MSFPNIPPESQTCWITLKMVSVLNSSVRKVMDGQQAHEILLIITYY